MIKRPNPQIHTSLLPDLTALIDVIFLLLVFLLLTVGTQLKAFRVDLPKNSDQSTTRPVAQNTILLEVLAQSLVLDGVPVSDEDALLPQLRDLMSPLSQNMADEISQKKLVLALEKDLDVQRLLDILSLLRSADFEAANILVKPEER